MTNLPACGNNVWSGAGALQPPNLKRVFVRVFVFQTQSLAPAPVPEAHFQLNDNMQFDFIDDDTPGHASLDAKVYASLNAILNVFNIMFDSDHPPPPAIILHAVQEASPEGMFISMNMTSRITFVADHSRDPNGDENSNLTKLLVSCWEVRKFGKIRCLSEHELAHFSYVLQYHRNFAANACTNQLGG